MDGQIAGIKSRTKADTREEWTDALNETPLDVRTEECVCVRERHRLTDDPVCVSQRCTRRNREGGVSGGRGTWMERRDRFQIDLTGRTSPGEKDTQRNRDVAEEALTDGWREDRREAE